MKIKMYTAKEKAIHLVNEAYKKSYFLSPTIKMHEAKDIALEQLKVARDFIYIAVMIEDIDKGIRKTLDFIDSVKIEIEKL